MADTAEQLRAEKTLANVRRRRSRAWRWSARLAIVVVVLLVVVAIARQMVLSTAVPKRVLIAQLQKQLGLRVEARSVGVSWLGHTVLRDVTMAMPLAEKSFLDMPELRVEHTAVPWVVLTRSVEIESIELDRPTLQVLQDASGRWNVLEAVQLIARTGGAKQADQQKTKSAIVIPAVTVNGGTIQITDNHQRSATITPLVVRGRPDGPLAWRYDAAVENHLQLTGQLAPGAEWEHEVEFDVANVRDWLTAWTSDAPDIR